MTNSEIVSKEIELYKSKAKNLIFSDEHKFNIFMNIMIKHKDHGVYSLSLKDYKEIHHILMRTDYVC